MLSTGRLLDDLRLVPAVVVGAGRRLALERSGAAVANSSARAVRRFLTDVLPRGGGLATRPSELCDPIEVLRAMPTTDRRELGRRVAAWREQTPPGQHFFVGSTGSTGVPVKMWFDDEYMVAHLGRYLATLARHRIWTPPLCFDRIHLTRSPDSNDLRFLQPATGMSLYYLLNVHPERRSGAELVGLLDRYRPSVLSGTPTWLLELATHVEELGKPARRRNWPLLLRASAEPLLDETRARLRDVFGCPVESEYGLSEVGGYVAEECRAADGFHVDVIGYHVEIVDPDGRPVSDGLEGEVVITNLDSTTVPICRYRTGDLATLTRERCSCGSWTPRIRQLSGRTLTQFRLPEGGRFDPFEEFGRLLWRLRTRQFQLSQIGSRTLRLSYEAVEDRAGEDACRDLETAVRRLYGPDATLIVERVAGFAAARKHHAYVNRVEFPDAPDHAMRFPQGAR